MHGIALEIELAAFGLGWLWEGDGARVARVHVLVEGFDARPLAGAVAAFVEAKNAAAALEIVLLQFGEFDLQRVQLLFEQLALHALVVRVAAGTHCCVFDRLREFRCVERKVFGKP